MKRAVYALLILSLGAMGCASGFGWQRPEGNVTPREARRHPAGPVTPDQVTPANAHDVSQALWDEVDSLSPVPPISPPPNREHNDR